MPTSKPKYARSHKQLSKYVIYLLLNCELRTTFWAYEGAEERGLKRQ